MLKLLPLHRRSVSDYDQRDTMDRQRQATAAIALQHGAVLLPAVEVENVSGSDWDQTPEWQDRVLPALQDPETHIAADSVDRILRVNQFNFRVFQQLSLLGKKIYIQGNIYDPSQPEDEFLLGLFAILAGREKSEIKRRIQAGKEARRKRGEWAVPDHLLPFGIVYDRKTKKWSYADGKADLVKDAYEAYVSRGDSLKTIAQRVGVTHAGVRVILRNPIYRGMLIFDRKRGAKLPQKNGRQPDRAKVARKPEEQISHRVYGSEGQEPQLVPDWLWQAAQHKLQESKELKAKYRETAREDSWASSFLTSALTARGFGVTEVGLGEGGSHNLHATGSVNKKFYVCVCQRTSGRTDKCSIKQRRTHIVHGWLEAYFSELVKSESVYERIKNDVLKYDPELSDQDSIAELELSIEKLDRKIARWNELYAEGEVTKEKRDQKVTDLRREISNIRSKQMKQPASKPVVSEGELREAVDGWTWDSSWNAQQKRDWLKYYGVRVFLNSYGISWVEFRFPMKNGMPVYWGSATSRLGS